MKMKTSNRGVGRRVLAVTMVGLMTAKALAHAAGKPLIAVNHLEGHALSPRLADRDLDFPYLLLLVSGGHCQLLFVEGVGRYRRLVGELALPSSSSPYSVPKQ